MIRDERARHQAEIASCLLDKWKRQQVLQRCSLLWSESEHTADDIPQIIGILSRQWFVIALSDTLVQAGHVFSLEGQVQGRHLVRNTAQRPHIAFEVVGLIAPNLRACVIRRASLRVIKAILTGQFGYIQIANLNNIVICEEDIC